MLKNIKRIAVTTVALLTGIGVLSVYAEGGTGNPVTISSENDAQEVHVHVGEVFSFASDLDTFTVNGPTENGEKYRTVLKEVVTPAGGTYSFDPDDEDLANESFTALAQDAGLTYTAVYQAQKSLDDVTWDDVANVTFERRIIVDEAAEEEEQQGSVHLGGDESAGISIGSAYTFIQDDHTTVSGPTDNGEQYRVVVKTIATPEGGSYTYTEGDTSFTPTEADRGLVYTITYGAQVSTDGGATWQEVPNVSSVTYLTVEHVQIGLRAPVYPGLFAGLSVAFDEETYTGSLVSTTVNIAINGTTTADDPFYMDVIVPKQGIHSKDDADPRYRFQISDLPQALDTSFTEDTNNYIKTYKLKPGTDALVYSIPMKLKMLRSGLVTAGTLYTVKLRIRTLNGTVIKETDNTTKMKIEKPIAIRSVLGTWNFNMNTDSPYLDATGTALKTDVNSIPDVSFYTQMTRNVPLDFNGDEVGIRKIAHIVDTYTLPDITYVDTATLPAGCVWNPATHTMTCTVDDSTLWSSVIPFNIKLPGAVINQNYPVEVKREYQFSDPSENFSFTFHQDI